MRTIALEWWHGWAACIVTNALWLGFIVLAVRKAMGKNLIGKG